MTLEELITEIHKNVICNSLTDDECYKYSIDCKDCPYKHIRFEKLLPDVLKYLEQLKECNEEYEKGYEEGYKKGNENILLQLNGAVITNDSIRLGKSYTKESSNDA